MSNFFHFGYDESSNSGTGIPIGIIAIWSGTFDNIPVGWAVCDGENGTPDLREKFVLGATVSYPNLSLDSSKHYVGDTGGEETHTLTVAEMPSHNHSGSTNSSGAHTHTWSRGNNQLEGYGNYVCAINSAKNGTVTVPSSGSHSHSISLNAAGGDAAHNNMPPYYALLFIMYVGKQ